MFLSAGMAELADAADLKSAGLKKLVGVRVPLSAPTETQGSFDSAQDFVLRRRSGQALRAPASLTPAKRLNLKSAGLKKLVGVRVPLSAPGLYTFRAQRGIPFVTMVDREIFLGSFDSAALRSGFRLRAPASLTPAKRLNLKSAGLKKLVGVRVPLSAPSLNTFRAQRGIPILTMVDREVFSGSFDSAALRSGFRLRAPASLTPARRLNLKSAGLKKLVGVRVPLSAPSLNTFRAQRGIPILTMVDREVFSGSFDSAALRSGFRLRAPASLTPARRLNL